MADGNSPRDGGPGPKFFARPPPRMSIRGGHVRVAGESARDHQEEYAMKQYLISIYQPDGPPPPPEILDKVMADIEAIRAQLREAGSWVFGAGLHAPSTATVLRHKDGDLLDRRPVRRGQGAPGRLHHRQGSRPGRGAGVGPPLRAGDQPAHRGAPVPGRNRGLMPGRPASSAAEIEDAFRAEYGRAVAVLTPPSATSISPKMRYRTRSPWRCSGGHPTACRRARPAGSSPPPATGRSIASAGRRPVRTAMPRLPCCTPWRTR